MPTERPAAAELTRLEAACVGLLLVLSFVTLGYIHALSVSF